MFKKFLDRSVGVLVKDIAIGAGGLGLVLTSVKSNTVSLTAPVAATFLRYVALALSNRRHGLPQLIYTL